MYESPIEVMYGEIHSKMVKDEEDRIMYEVNRQVGVNVKKEDLLKALEYDRHQYEKGYEDAMTEFKVKLKEIINQNSYARTVESSEYFMGKTMILSINVDCFNELFESED